MNVEKRKRTKIIGIATVAFASFLLAVCLTAAPAMADGYLMDYRRPNTISNTAGDLTDYQVKIEYDFSAEYSAGKIQQYCDNIRFTYYNVTSGAETEIPYWAETCNLTANSTATFWVKVPFMANNTDTIVYMYYGNPSASSASSLTNTFTSGSFSDTFTDETKINITDSDNINVSEGDVKLSGYSTGKLINTLNDSSTAKNLIFTGNENKTVWIKLPKNAAVSSATMNVSGYEALHIQDSMCVGGNSWDLFSSTETYTNNFARIKWNYDPGYCDDSFATQITCNDDGVTISTAASGDVYYTCSDITFTGYAGELEPWYGSNPGERYVETLYSIYLYGCPTNVTLDTGNDGTSDCFLSGTLNPTNSPQKIDLNKTVINNYLSTCSADVFRNCDVPLVLHSDTAGKIKIDAINVTYDYQSANLTSIAIPEDSNTCLAVGTRLSWNDTEPTDTDVKYQIEYRNYIYGTSWQLIPNSDLSGNSDGFEDSPVDIFSVKTKYGRIRLKATLTTTNDSLTPAVHDWNVTYYYRKYASPEPSFVSVGAEQPVPIEVDKTVWDPVSGTWVKATTAVSDTLRFRCVIHNTGRFNLTNITVSDILSDSLNYSDNATVDGVPMEPVQVGPNKYEWNFTSLELEPCKNITIEFDASVVMPGTDTNVQNASAWCELTEEWVSDEDSVSVTVPVPSIEVDKAVWDPVSKTWVKETTAVSDTLRFRSVITNTGLFNLTNITVSDILSDCLNYSDNAMVDGVPMEPVQVGPNEYEWNFTSLELEPCKNITIEFDASVVMLGTGINVQNASAWYEQTGVWVSDVDSVSVTVPAILVWQYGATMPWDVERLSNNNILIVEHGGHRVIEVTLDKQIVWQYGTGTSGSEPGQLYCPTDAERLSDNNTLITDRMNERVIEVNSTGEIVWQYGNGTPGSGINQLDKPRDAERLENGNTLIADRLNNRVIEVRTADYDPTRPNNNFTSDSIVWQMTGINHPADAELLPNGNMLIVVYNDHTVIEINTTTKEIVWQYGTTGTEGSGINQLKFPESAERLPNNNTLIADRMNNRIIEVTPANIIIRQYGTGVEGSGENELKQPADAERLSSGSTLIADTGNNRVITVITMPPPAPTILSFAPPSPVYNVFGVERTFSITIDQAVDVEWRIDGWIYTTDAGVTESSYTFTAQEGMHTVSAIASNANGTDMQQWDWKVVSELGPDLIVSMINAYHNNTGCPAWFNLSNEVDVTVTNIGTEPVGETSVSLAIEGEEFGKLPVPGLDAGASETVTFENWMPVGDDCLKTIDNVCHFEWSYKDYNIRAVADCDNNVRKESDETNNEATVVERACYNGYMADEPLENVAHGTLHGGLLFTTGDGKYSSLYSMGSTQVTNYDITIPDGAAVELAHLNVYYTWNKPQGTCPEMEVRITTPSGTTYTLPLMKAYNDIKCTCPGATWILAWGNYVYNVTDYITESGTYTVTVKNVCIKCRYFCPAAPGIVLVYEDENAPTIEYWINEGADVLMGGRRYSTSSNLAWWENINNATFQASTETLNVASATLGVVSPWGGSSWRPGSTNYLFFNDVKLGTGVYHGYSFVYKETIDGITMEVNGTNAQVGVNVADVTAFYLNARDNVVGQADDGDNMMPSNAFLVVEYCREEKPEPAVLVPFMVSGFAFNYSDGTPINNPGVTITNNTGEPFTVETRNDSNYYQVLTSLEKVSCGDVLRFTCGGTSVEHRVRQSEIDAGGFELNITCTEGEIPPEVIQAGVTFNKKRLDLNSSGILNAFITLPEGYNVTEINVSTVECEGASAELEGGGFALGKDAFEVKFKIPGLKEKGVKPGPEVELTVTGELFDGTLFEGSNTLKVV